MTSLTRSCSVTMTRIIMMQSESAALAAPAAGALRCGAIGPGPGAAGQITSESSAAAALRQNGP